MTAVIMNMRSIVTTLRQHIRRDILAFSREHNQTPCLVMLGFWGNRSTMASMQVMGQVAAEVGINYWAQLFPPNIKAHELQQRIEQYNNDPTVHAISLQLPLPEQLNLSEITNSITPEKDVEGLNAKNLGLVMMGQPALVPPPVLSALKLLNLYNVKPTGRHIVVVGRDVEIGRALANMLIKEGATVTICHNQTANLRAYTRQAEILVGAAHEPRLIKYEMVRPGAVVIDFGLNFIGRGQPVGDVDFEQVRNLAAAITPTPGGIWPLSNVCLLENVLKAARSQVSGETSINKAMADASQAQSFMLTNDNVQSTNSFGATTSYPANSSLNSKTNPFN